MKDNRTFHDALVSFAERRVIKMDFLIEVDGGINVKNGNECIKRGANILVAGAFAVFQGELKKSYEDFQKALFLPRDR